MNPRFDEMLKTIILNLVVIVLLIWFLFNSIGCTEFLQSPNLKEESVHRQEHELTKLNDSMWREQDSLKRIADELHNDFMKRTMQVFPNSKW